MIVFTAGFSKVVFFFFFKTVPFHDLIITKFSGSNWDLGTYL